MLFENGGRAEEVGDFFLDDGVKMCFLGRIDVEFVSEFIDEKHGQLEAFLFFFRLTVDILFNG